MYIYIVFDVFGYVYTVYSIHMWMVHPFLIIANNESLHVSNRYEPTQGISLYTHCWFVSIPFNAVEVQQNREKKAASLTLAGQQMPCT